MPAAPRKVIMEQTYDLTDPTVNSQLINLSKSGADVFYNISTGKATSQSIRKVAELGWKPLQLLSAGSTGRSILNAAGFENAKDIVAIRYAKEVGVPRWEKDPDVMAFEELRKKYLPTVDPDNTIAFAGYGQVATMARNPAPLRRRSHPRQCAEAGVHARRLPLALFPRRRQFQLHARRLHADEDALHLDLQRQGLGYFRQAGDGVGARRSSRLAGRGWGEGSCSRRVADDAQSPHPDRMSQRSDLPRKRGEATSPPLDEPAATAYLLCRAAPHPHTSRPETGRAAAGPFPDMVRRARLVAARASAGAAGQGARRPLGAADRADRRRQDAGRLSADAGGAVHAAVGGRWRSSLISTGRERPAQRRPAHALHLAAEGAGGRRRPQPGSADRGDGPADQGRDPHRRHAGVAAAAPAALSAGHPADHAGAAGAAARLRRRAVPVRLAEAHRARRTARAGHLQARRSAVAGAGAALAAGAGAARDRPVRHRGRARISWRASWCRSPTGKPSVRRHRRRRRRRARRIVEMLDTKERLPWAGHTARHALRRDLRADQGATRPRWSSSTPAARPRCCSRISGA